MIHIDAGDDVVTTGFKIGLLMTIVLSFKAGLLWIGGIVMLWSVKIGHAIESSAGLADATVKIFAAIYLGLKITVYIRDKFINKNKDTNSKTE